MNQLSIGTATIDITPPEGATMVGYTPRVSTSIDHPLEAEALYASDGKAEWLLLSADFLGLRRNQSIAARKMIAEATGVTPEAISICGTHTHSGPAVILAESSALSGIDRSYLESLWARLTEVSVAAKRNASPGLFEAGEADLVEVGSNRRVKLPDGSWTNEWRDPEGTHPGFFDPTLTVVVVRRPDGSLSAAMVNYGVHPVVLGPSSLAISPDYPGYLKEALRATLGVDDVLFLLAGAANINPRHCILEGAVHPKSTGGSLASFAVSTALRPLSAGIVQSSRIGWELIRDRDAYKRAGLNGDLAGDRIETEVCALRAGDLSIITIPGELFSEFNSQLRRESPTGVTLVATLANDYIGYIPTDLAQEEGAYETKMAPASGLEPLLLERASRAFEGVKK